ncbi:MULTISPECIES: SusC/RagA family TonB-linked outer membrane protein [unclassified Kaistella]|uniref:SusC/RagA family TonB-linked outer membrane protein n=1 Tax=unclassified Kaistella TaxID=2762626 RepID=UPI0027351BCD|nr:MULTISPECIES: SusC/RagA family TonB-linked outer membrane protein [unclassified Kaistella]MDP2452499.1 SusC/RagA family TonB-linked outer membrane protein [Kaistella sp. SH11-4b]MDP2455407.1 SusC/RagA family TonB-linked outer membrane protein [Kaistella sp. SH40-3]MDP2458311.1 SusC/RagA family TonB-linked outer membrane protein [Kaistella sp. SH19-2b]
MKKILSNIGVVSCCLIFSAIHSQAKAQTRTVTGTVNDKEKPIGGVIVTQEGTNQVTTTSSSGTFNLQISGENPILIFRHPEYAERKITTNGKSTFTISLTEKVKSIEEVVLNAGYYNVKARESTGSIARVTAKDIENQPVTNVLSAVQGRMAGVSIVQNTGTPGGGYDVQIRGRNSLRNILNSSTNGNQPMYIVDGVPWIGKLPSAYSIGVLPTSNINPLNALNPDDIESIAVLKDADATAIYGSRGGNGVILITTKRGKAGAVRVTASAATSYSTVAGKLKMMDTQEYLSMRRQAYANVGTVNYPANAYDINGTWDPDRHTDWQKELIGGTAENFSARVAVSGGSEKNSFSISAGHNDQTSVFPGDHHYKINTFTSSYTYRSQDARLVAGLSNSFSFTGNNSLNQDITGRAISLSPNAPALYDAAGNLNWQNNTFNNPLSQVNASYSNKTQLINQNLNLVYRPGGDFSIKLNTGFTHQELEEFSLSPNTMYIPSSASSTSPAYSSAARATGAVLSYLAEPQVDWKKKFALHELNVLAGITYQQTETKSSAMRGTGFASNALLQNIAAAATVTISPFIDNEYRYAAFFGRLNYQFANRYIVNLTARRDGSSRFGPNKKFANFGAVGAAWIISEERFMKNIRWLSLAKIRGSYGHTGSDAVGDYQFTDTFTLSTSAYNNIPGLYPSRLFNPDYSWERTDKIESAVELSFLRDRLTLTAAWYRNRSSNQLIGIPLSTVTGFSSILANLDATVENSGIEVDFGSTPVNNSNWKWTAGFNISIPKNKLLAFPDLENSSYANTYIIGESIYTVKLFDYLGINRNTGQYEFRDFNGDGKITTPDDAKAIRTLGPEYFGGLYSTLKYRNIDISVLFQFTKQQNWNYYRTMAVPGGMLNQPNEFLDVWSAENQDGIIMPYTPGNHALTNTLTGNLRNSIAAVGDASFIRLKNIQLNYRLPLRNPPIREASVYLQGQNIWTWTKYFGLDPEFITSGYLPPLKTFSLGFLITL